jgi:hypothetical protein
MKNGNVKTFFAKIDKIIQNKTEEFKKVEELYNMPPSRNFFNNFLKRIEVLNCNVSL